MRYKYFELMLQYSILKTTTKTKLQIYLEFQQSNIKILMSVGRKLEILDYIVVYNNLLLYCDNTQ